MILVVTVHNWAFKGLPYSDFGAHVWTIWYLDPGGVTRSRFSWLGVEGLKFGFKVRGLKALDKFYVSCFHVRVEPVMESLS